VKRKGERGCVLNRHFEIKKRVVAATQLLYQWSANAAGVLRLGGCAWRAENPVSTHPGRPRQHDRHDQSAGQPGFGGWEKRKVVRIENSRLHLLDATLLRALVN